MSRQEEKKYNTFSSIVELRVTYYLEVGYSLHLAPVLAKGLADNLVDHALHIHGLQSHALHMALDFLVNHHLHKVCL